ncbi:gamma-aminobutyric acid receptor subunit beta-like [Exaiptasia diaphana]|uniref:Uncharacterized protein n=1 Tax=Exaiptasia diaphana TaxID=2652724 RepID=A0A913XE04_EXADI|nr:gamma-aminobutyric acid receptor subunit beta-like [Exaiptasia diaphana]XP_020903218.1 gamma-aminobutyric acid receptor subunit beta-like [Exaiptasia diaphana]XP_020903219.1 gamma-aminobutyric acid receptor subunit beta-like [Exaiptasia diaphana]
MLKVCTVVISLILAGMVSRCSSSRSIHRRSTMKVIDEKMINAGNNMSQMIQHILENYDKNVRPFYEVKPIEVQFDMLVLSFGEIKEADMLFTADIYVGQFWQDPRFAYGINNSISLGGDFVDKFWIPDTFFVNSVDIEVHKMMSPNKKVWIHLDKGHIMLSARLKSKATCKMDLRKYPMDQQTCHLAIESFSFDETDLKYKWKNPVGSDVFIYDAEMAQFNVMSVVRNLKHPVYHSRRFSGLTVTFTFKRRTMYYIFQMYIPCICIVALSWVSFWVDADAVPARVGLSITTVLTICYMLGSVNSNLPRVSYLKAIDYFLLLSFGFIFLTLVEYVVVLKYTRRRKYSGSFSPPKCKSGLIEEEWDDKKMMEVKIQIGSTAYTFKDSLSNLTSAGKENEKSPKNGEMYKTSPRKPVKTCDHSKPILPRCVEPDNTHPIIRFLKKPFTTEEGENKIDNFARFFFPFSYGMFLLVYFSYFFS